MVAIDVQPFRTVEDQGFRELVRCLDSRYELPSRNTILNVHIQKLYENGKTKLQAILNEIESCAITTDCWSSKANESYLTVTCHFIDGDFKIRSAVLTTSKLANELNHSAANISVSLRECLQKWNIFQKVNCEVTDNAASMSKACELLQNRHLPCFAHSINLVVQDLLCTEKVKALLSNCKHIVAYFKSSTIAYAKLKKEQGSEKQYSLIQEVSTRWNSAFAMVQRILLIKDAIFAVLLRTPKAPPVLTAEEIEQLQDVCLLLEPFNTYISILSGNKYVTISHVIPIAWGLHSTLMKLQSKLKTFVGSEAQLYLCDKIKQRLFPYESRSATRLATLLDPRFKKEGFQSGQNAAQASMLLENELVEIDRIAASSLNDNREGPSTSKSVKIPQIYEFLKEKLSSKVKSNRADAIITLREYTEKPNEPLDVDPLEYWKID
ncbi:E3 SUMO-protein ligase ZBED1-like isoform X2 [Bactrocera neohumeralis]|uniref:E3 SUMO-protein ligase ZBED1-like isoform X2 n=1 Tax=Bactrocera neohumeralis TaxID=98809 RepID=UPI0021658FB7|nr:E3 SUMO-protein ligase ZBED1-like isoform X2 [Bactrocera neohumeralis]